MLLAVLLDASTATMVIALVALLGGAVNGGSLEITAYIFLGGMAGIIAVRRGDRLQVFLQASIAVFAVCALVVSVFSFCASPGHRDIQGVLELWFASAAVGGRLGRSPRSAVRGAGLGLRDPDGLPAAGARESVAAAAAPAARRDAGHLPPLADGGQSRRTGGRGDRRRSARDPRRGVLPRHRQAREPAGLHREPGRRREHPRPARSRESAPGSSSSMSPTGSTSPIGRSCRRRSSPTSRSTTGRRS